MNLGKLAGAWEHTIVFVFFLFILLLGLLMAARLFGSYLEPNAKGLAVALESA